MSSLALPIPTAAPVATSAAASSSAARGRDAQAANNGNDGFGAALARTREARPRPSDDKADAPSGTPATRRRALASDAQDGRKESSPAELLAMAMLTPIFNTPSAQQRHAAATGGDSPLRATVDAGKAAAAEQPLADVATTAADSDALPAEAAGDGATMQAAAQAAKARADDTDADARPPKARTEAAAPSADMKSAAATTPAPVAPAAVLPTPQAAAASPASEKSSAAVASGSSASGKAAPEPAALAAQAREPALPDPVEGQSDTPAPSAAALNFKTALAEATGASSTAQAQHVPRLPVATPVGSENWGADIGTQMIRMSSDGHHVAELSLNPAGLGPLKVTLTLGDSQAQAQFVSAHESVRRAVEAALPQLRDTLAGQGIQLGQASINAGTQQQQQQQAFAQQQERAFDGPARPASLASDAAALPERATPAPRSRGAIDTFA